MDIAIQFEKINLGNDRFLFKPLGIIKGKLNKELNKFETEHGVICDSMVGNDIYSDNYYSLETTMEELKKYYGEELDESELLSGYLDVCMQNLYVGSYDYVNDVINVVKFSYDSIDDTIREMYSGEVEYDNDEQVKIYFDLDAIKDLRDTKTIEEIYSKLDIIIDASSKLLDSKKQEEISVDTDSKDVKTGNLSLKKEESKRISLLNLKKEVLSKIIGQDKAVNTVTTALAVNYSSKNPRHKSHILIAGPSGTGKTEMINIMANYLGIPYFKADATAYTKEGYVGKSVYSMLLGLIAAADGDVEKAQNGILIIDEIDKKVVGNKSDVAGQAVLHSLLKIMDRGVIEVNKDYYTTTTFDTSNLTIIFMGAFADLYSKKKIASNKVIGFNSDNTIQDQTIKLTEEDFIKYGMTAEFMGRIGTITSTEEFSLEDLVKILYKSKISPLHEEKEFFEDLGIKLTFTSAYVREIAKKCQKNSTGARNLKKLVKESLEHAYSDVLTNDKVKVLKLTKQTVLDNTKYYVE